MNLSHTVRVPVGLDEAWAAVNDPRRLAPAVPGAVVESFDGDRFTGTLKLKLGPLPLAFDGSGHYAERDESAHRLVLRTSGTDRRGHGAVSAAHTMTLSRVDAGQTEIAVQTDLSVDGRPGQLGRGVVAEATDRLAEQFTGRVVARVAERLSWLPEAEPLASASADAEADAVVDAPVELGATFGDLVEPEAPAPSRTPSPRPGPAPVTPRPQPGTYEYRPYSYTAEPHLHAARSLGRVLVTKVAPYAGFGALLAYAAATVVRRRRSARGA
jgi:carbon monoxide dehydrogenase subunit G